MTACRRALAAAFLAYADGDKKCCVAVLDAVSSSYREKRDRATCPVLEQKNFHQNLNRIWEKHQSVLSEKSLRIHAAFELPWFMALLCRARKKGVLASSQFMWLRRWTGRSGTRSINAGEEPRGWKAWPPGRTTRQKNRRGRP